MRVVEDIVRRAADTNATILLQGESGTGKEMVARAIHNISDRRDKPFLKVNCASLPGTCSNPSCSVTRRARSREPTAGSRASSSWPTGDLLAGRDRRDAPRAPGQAAPRAPGRPVLPGGRQRRHHVRRPAHRGDQQEPGLRHDDRLLPGGPVLPPERGGDLDPTPPGAAGGDLGPGRVLHESLLPPVQPRRPEDLRGDHRLLQDYSWPGNVESSRT